MRMKIKIPEGLTNVSNMMEMQKEEIMAWQYYPQVAALLKDYNLNAITKTDLIDKLLDISVKCAEDGIYYFCTGIDKLIVSVKHCY